MKTALIKEPQSATLLNTPEEITSGISRVEKMGRLCWKSDPKGDPAKFIKMIIGRQHDSVLEHMSLSFILVTNRAISHQLVRHRLCSFSQESQRYCNYYDKKNDTAGLRIVEPKGFSTWEPSVQEDFTNEVHRVAEMYATLIANGCKPEAARAILPNCTATSIGVTANIRQWRHLLSLRLDKHADPQMIELANLIVEQIPEEAMFLFEDIVEKCSNS